MKHGRATLTISLETLRVGFWRYALPLATVVLLLIFSLNGPGIHISAVWLSFLVISLCSHDQIALSNDPKFRWVLMSAPLYGRELARAVALTPAVLAGVLGLIIGFAVAPNDARIAWMIAAACGAITATIIGLSSTVRKGKERLVFFPSAMLAGFGIAYIGTLGGPMTTAASVLLAAVGSYFALRAFGETFARLDLVD